MAGFGDSKHSRAKDAKAVRNNNKTLCPGALLLIIFVSVVRYVMVAPRLALSADYTPVGINQELAVITRIN